MSREQIQAALHGPVPSLRTPFLQTGEVDYTGLRTLVDFAVAAGSKAVMLTAGDSHYICLSEQEMAEVTRVVVEHTAGRAVVIAADRYFGTSKALAFAEYVRDLGTDLLMLMPPDWGGSSTPQTLAEHYCTVAKVMPVMIVTNVFVPRGLDFGLETLRLTMAATDKVIALKDDFCGLFARKAASLICERWAMVSGGQKTNHLDAHPYGCQGYLSSFMTFKPEVAHRYWDAIQSGNLCAAAAVVRNYDMPFFDVIMKLRGGFDAGMHGTLELFGLAGRWRRKPYATLDDREMEQLAEFFRSKDLL